MYNDLDTLYEFPTLKSTKVKYFDYASTTFMPYSVMNSWKKYNVSCGVSIGRGSSILSNKATKELKKSEQVFKDFFGFDEEYDFIYAKNVTEGINLISLAIKENVNALDIILVGPFEHHSNYLPWKRLAKENGALFFEIPVLDNGEIDYDYIKKYKSRIKIISISSVCNTFGYKINIDKICDIIDYNTFLFVDDSQFATHNKLVQNDKISGHFISSHKMYGPKNISLIALKKDVIYKLSPVLLGGGMVETVGYNSTWLEDRRKFFSGTMDISLVVAFADACKFMESFGFELIQKRDEIYYHIIEQCLLENGYNIVRIGECVNYIISFTHPKIHSHDINEYLSKENIIIRSGNVCSQNSLKKIEFSSINRISFGLGVSLRDIYYLCDCLRRIVNEENVFKESV